VAVSHKTIKTKVRKLEERLGNASSSSDADNLNPVATDQCYRAKVGKIVEGTLGNAK
jgi:hypothetical protein